MTAITKTVYLRDEGDYARVTLLVEEIVEFIKDCRDYEKKTILELLTKKDISLFESESLFEMQKFEIFKEHQAKFSPDQLEKLLS